MELRELEMAFIGAPFLVFFSLRLRDFVPLRLGFLDNRVILPAAETLAQGEGPKQFLLQNAAASMLTERIHFHRGALPCIWEMEL
ncbi:MAG: hypothetical protein ACR2FY_02350 [Pirellulaceae bacterium]